ncbi:MULTISPECIES: NAD(P)-dependent oxidoreductase [unclassified Phaeobacter]|uniref:NAD(P)-dependent oxidoreductase n=1 Tax=unclassified Phaeobacter TaxID=2621772 RepID=UPI003A88D28B
MAMNERVGVVGLGKMGAALAARLAEQGCSVSGWTRSGVDVDWAGARGIGAPAILDDLVAEVDIVLLSLFDDGAVAAVLDRLITCDLRGKLVVDTSTVNPATLKGYADRITAAGAGVLDAPVSGWPKVVSMGQAGVFIGGEPVDVARFVPVAELFANRVFHVGPLGQGLATKIVNNIMLASYWQSLREALGVGRSLGLPGELMLDILISGPAANGALSGKSEIILGKESPASFTVAGIAKDLGVFCEVAAQGGVATPALQAALESFTQFRDAGYADRDFAAMPGAILKDGNDVL